MAGQALRELAVARKTVSSARVAQKDAERNLMFLGLAAIDLGRAVYQNSRHMLVSIFSHNIAELAPILAAAFASFPRSR